MLRPIARALLAVSLMAGIHVAAPTQAIAEFRAAHACASHCAKMRGDERNCAPRCCLIGPETSSVATLSAAAHVERPVVALPVTLAPAALAAPLAVDRIARLDQPRGAGPPIWLTVQSLRL